MRKHVKFAAEQAGLFYAALLTLNFLSFTGVRYTAKSIWNDLNNNNFRSTVRAYEEEVIKPLDRLPLSGANPAYFKVYYDTFMDNVNKYHRSRMTFPMPKIPRDYKGTVMVSNSDETARI